LIKNSPFESEFQNSHLKAERMSWKWRFEQWKLKVESEKWDERNYIEVEISPKQIDLMSRRKSIGEGISKEILKLDNL